MSKSNKEQEHIQVLSCYKIFDDREIYNVFVKNKFKETRLYLGRPVEAGDLISAKEFAEGLDQFSLFNITHLYRFLSQFGKFVQNNEQVSGQGMNTYSPPEWKFISNNELSSEFEAFVRAVIQRMHRTANVDFSVTPPRISLVANEHNLDDIFMLGVEVERLKWAKDKEKLAWKKKEHNKHLRAQNKKNNTKLRNDTTERYIEKIRKWLKENGHWPKKTYGQEGFLSNEKLANKINDERVVLSLIHI